MGWQIQWEHRLWETVDGNTLRRYASSGELLPTTKVKSLSKNAVVLAADIAGLFPVESDPVPPPDWNEEFRWDPAMHEKPKNRNLTSRKSVIKRSRHGILDIHFRSFVTVELVSLVWQIAVWFIALGCITQVLAVIRFAPLSADPVIRSTQLVVAAFVSLAIGIVATLAVRVVLEVVVVVFKIEEHLRK